MSYTILHTVVAYEVDTYKVDAIRAFDTEQAAIRLPSSGGALVPSSSTKAQTGLAWLAAMLRRCMQVAE
jgi:hypothetical protein